MRLSAVLFIVFILFFVLWHASPPWYFGLLQRSFEFPYERPFIDLQSVQSAITCWAEGVNVYLDNSCDLVPGGRHSYSPLWLRATFIPHSLTWLPWMGVGLATAFILSLAWLPQTASRLGFVALVLAGLSSDTVFALERGNMDLVIYLFLFLAVACLARGGQVRWLGYALILAAGLLKFYPLVVMLLALRERPSRFLLVCVASAIALAVFVGLFHAELALALGNVPTGSPFMDMFGAAMLPRGLYTLQALMPSWLPLHTKSFSASVAIVVALCAAVVAVRFGKSAVQRRALAALPPRTAILFIAGAATICGCFLAGPNIGYRGIFLLLALPGLLALTDEAKLRRRLGATLIIALLLMWDIAIYHQLRRAGLGKAGESDATLVVQLFWLVRQIGWWWLVSTLLSLLVSFCLDSPIVSALRRAVSFRDRSIASR